MSETLDGALGYRLLKLARDTIGCRLGVVEEIDRTGLEREELQQSRGTFVTLKIDGSLRGCIGNLESAGTIVESVGRNALSTAFEDHRFPPLRAEEFDTVHISLSILTVPRPLEYMDASELHRLIRPGVDGVILQAGKARATFLPQVWRQLPDLEQFLDHLCVKAGLPRSAWRTLHPDLYLYEAQCFEE